MHDPRVQTVKYTNYIYIEDYANRNLKCQDQKDPK